MRPIGRAHLSARASGPECAEALWSNRIRQRPEIANRQRAKGLERRSRVASGLLPVLGAPQDIWASRSLSRSAARSLPASARRALASLGRPTVMRISREDRRTSSHKAPDLKPDLEIAEQIPARSRLPSNIRQYWRVRFPDDPTGRTHPWPCLRFHSRLSACRLHQSRDCRKAPR